MAWQVTRQMYVSYPAPNASAVISCDYVGAPAPGSGATGLRRQEVLTHQIHDDVYQDPQRRLSDDNGRTWSDWQPDVERQIVRGQEMWWQWEAGGLTPGCRDPESGLLVKAYMLRCFQGGDPRQVGLTKTTNYVFVATSADDGLTWSPRQQLKYEPGPDYGEDTRETPPFLERNRCHYCNNIIAPRSGGVILPVSSPASVIDEQGNAHASTYVRCFMGKWDKARQQYDWGVSAPITISRSQSGYLEEPRLAELADGRLLLDMRGTNGGRAFKKPGPWMSAPGRHWYALSSDGRRTWSDVSDWRYDTGETFYSPATMAKLLRHSRTGKLYWFGNISRGPTNGNVPRYPFYIAQVDESKPAIRKDTLTIIDDCGPSRDSPEVQFSNFFVFENRETGAFELYLSPYGQYGASKPGVYQADVCRYLITLEGDEQSPHQHQAGHGAASQRPTEGSP